MPTYQNASTFFNITYSSVQPAATAVYSDTSGRQFTILAVSGTGAAASYAISSPGAPVVGTLTKVSGTGDATVTLSSYTLQSVVMLGSVRVEPGQAMATLEYYTPALPFGVTQSSTSPYLDKSIYSVALTSTATVTVPTTAIDSSTGLSYTLNGNYTIKIYVSILSASGTVAVQLNSGSAVARSMGLYETYEVMCLSRTVNSFIVNISGTTTVIVNIEKI